MKLAGVLLTGIFVILQAAPASAVLPESIKEAAEAADGVVVGLGIGYGSGGSFPYIEVRVLEVLKGKDPGETLAAAFPQEAVTGVDIPAVQETHGTVFIIAYRGPKDERGRYAYAGPKFDSRQIIASPENIAAVDPKARIFEIPAFEAALRESDIVAVVEVSYENTEDSDGKKVFNIESDELHFRIVDVVKGDLTDTKIRLRLGGRYFYWLFYGGGFTVKGAPLVSQEPKLLLIKKQGADYYYAGPVFTSQYFLATPENIALVRRLNAGHKDLTWWIAGAAAALVALVAALLISKVDYKYDRRRERFEIPGDNPYSDPGPGSSKGKP
jgi:hypothetical protein